MIGAAVERLARALLWGTHLDHLAQAVREILLNDEQVDQMSVYVYWGFWCVFGVF